MAKLMDLSLPNDKQTIKYNLYEPFEIMQFYDECWLNQIDEAWCESSSFNDLVKHNKEFIKGNIPNTPIHLGALEDTDPDYIQNLLKLTDIGVLTTCGQQYLQKTFPNNKIVYQREHISLVYKFENGETLYNILKKFNNTDVFYYSIHSECYNKVPLIYQTPKLQKIGFNNPEFWITKSLDVTTDTFTNNTHVCEPEDLISEHNNYSYYVKDFYNDTVFFELWNIQWNNDSPLLPKVIQCFSE